jgi:mono/diheme cytochrome c family protein
MGMCKNCHTPEAYTQPSFTAKWNGKPLSELYSFIREQMPKNEPGSLTAEEYADVMAYLLRINRMAAGATDLPTEPADTKSIRIDLKPTVVRKDP